MTINFIKKWFFLSVFLGVVTRYFFFSLAHADGQLMVMPAKTTIIGQESKKVQVSNVGDKTLYLNIELYRIDNPGLNPEKKTTLGNINRPEMIVTPAKLTLGPGQKRDIHLTSLAEPLQETVYRLYIIPVSSIKIIGDESKNKIETPLTFGVGYGVVVFHTPPMAKHIKSWKYDCTEHGITLMANGNVQVTLSQLEGSPKNSHIGQSLKLFPSIPRTLSLKSLKGNTDGQLFDIQCP